MPFIIQHLSGQQSRIHFVPGAMLRIGRGTAAELRLDDPTVALEHAVIEPVAGGYRLSERGGVTGIYVNGRRVQEALLAANDLINIGGFQIRVQVTDPEDPLFLAVRARPEEDAPAVVAADARTVALTPERMAAAVAAAALLAGEDLRPRAPAPRPPAVPTGTAPRSDAPPPAPRLSAAPLPGAARQEAPPPAPEADRPAPAAPPPTPAPAVPPSAPAPAPPGPARRALPADVQAAVDALLGIDSATRDRPLPQEEAPERAPAPSSSREAAPVPDILVPAAGAPALPPPRSAASASEGGAVAAASAAGRPTPLPSTVPPGTAAPAGSAPSAPPSGQIAPPAAPRAPAASPGEPPAPPLFPGTPAAPPRPPAPPRAPVVDYLGALSLRGRFFNKTLLSAVLVLAAAAVLASLATSGRATAFEPGPVHRWHTEVNSCTSCHAPWRGAVANLCADCHATQRLKGEVHQARQVGAPPCTSCHPEHRGGERLAFVDDRTCGGCHADLQVTSGTPRFARSVHTFRDDHPDFSVTLPDGTRLPLAAAVERRADPTPLRFNHQRHLRAGLPAPGGPRVQLACDSCHRVAAGAGQTGMVPVRYRESCTTSGCHPLTFDEARPSQVAPHDVPERVREFLVSVYSDQRARSVSVGQQFRLLMRGQGAAPRGLDFGSQAQRGVVLAERYLYGTACKECHVVDANATPVPVVTWTPIPERWLPNARFSHLDHRTSPCLDCHAAAPASTAAADVLLPGVAVCRRCHGGGGGAAGGGGGATAGGGGGAAGSGGSPAGEAAGGAAARPASTECISCHGYHPGGRAATRTAGLSFSGHARQPA